MPLAEFSPLVGSSTWVGVGTDAWQQLLESPAALVVLAVAVYADAFTVILPGEAAVAALGAVAAQTGTPPLLAVVGVAWAAAFAGDVSCYLLGRATRLRDRARGRLRQALDQADAQLRRRGAVILFTARFVPFARLAVNLAAGTTRTPWLVYLPLVAAAALGWAIFQAMIGAALGAVLPGGPIVAAIAAIVAALVLGLAVDAVATFVRRRRTGRAPQP